MAFADEEKVRILLNEYNTLRSEIIARMGHGFQVTSISVAAFTFWAGRSVDDWRSYLALAFIFTLVAVAIWFTLRDTNKAAARIREIEADVNHRTGETLLVWETKWGGAVTGFWGLAKPKV